MGADQPRISYIEELAVTCGQDGKLIVTLRFELSTETTLSRDGRKRRHAFLANAEQRLPRQAFKLNQKIIDVGVMWLDRVEVTG